MPLTLHPLPDTPTYRDRVWAFVPGPSPADADHRAGTLVVGQRRGRRHECDEYGVEEQARVSTGRVFLLLNDTDADQSDVYEVFLADAGAGRDSCTCTGARCGLKCKHTEAVRAWAADARGLT